MISTPANELAARTMDLSAWLPLLQAIATACVPVIGAFIVGLLNKFVTIRHEANLRQALDLAVTNATGLLVTIAGDQMDGKSLDVRSPVVATALRYLQKAVPEAIENFGVDDGTLLQKMQAKLPGLVRGTEMAMATSSRPIQVSTHNPGPGQI